MVTVAVQVDELPGQSVTVRTTIFSPKSSQSKVLGATAKVTVPQLSDDPASTSAAKIVIFPLPFRDTVISAAAHIGAVVSSTPIIWLQVPVFPQLSVAIHVLTMVNSCVQTPATIASVKVTSGFASQASLAVAVPVLAGAELASQSM